MHTTHAPFACALRDSSILSKSAQASWVGFALERNLGTKQGVAPWTQCSGTCKLEWEHSFLRTLHVMSLRMAAKSSMAYTPVLIEHVS
jgi:hypothetical protein